MRTGYATCHIAHRCEILKSFRTYDIYLEGGEPKRL